METTAASTGLVDRMMRAARLDAAVYTEVEHDTTATTQAATVVVIGAIAGGIGTIGGGGDLISSIIAGVVSGLLGWAAFAYVAFLVGTKLLPGANTRADWGEVARTLGFAYTPNVLNVLGFIPGIGGLVRLVVSIWFLVATVVGLKAALEMSTGRAIAVAVVSGVALFVVFALIASVVAVAMP